MGKPIRQFEPQFDESEKIALWEYMDQGGWLTEFRKTAELEEMLARFIGVGHCVMMSNGTLSLAAALVAWGITHGDEVICPAYTMVASAHAITLAGATPVFVDVDPANLCLDYALTEVAVSASTKAIMLVTINGRHPKMEAFRQLCDDRGLLLLEDAAQSLGSRSAGKHLGTFGHIGSFSFSSPKIITTGQGGCLVTDDDELFERIRRVKDFGRAQGGGDIYEALGYNFKFTDLQAVIGIEQMKKLDDRIRRKKRIYLTYSERLKGIRGIEFLPTDLEDTAPWFMDILVWDRSGLQRHLMESGIGSRPFYPATHQQPPYPASDNQFPNADRAADLGLWLPSSPYLEEEELDYICDRIREFFEVGT